MRIASDYGVSHVAIIMDGNGRWARKMAIDQRHGHREGVAAVRRAIEAARDLALSYLTLYSFSTENWRRPKSEVAYLMALLKEFLDADLRRLVQENVRIRILGDKDNLPFDVKLLVRQAERETRANTGQSLNIAFNYGGRDEMTRAMRSIAERIVAGGIAPSDIDEHLVAASLDTAAIPDPEIVIRTSGEKRMSNFLLWQAAYAELVFIDAYWPDFNKEMFIGALEEYARRDRRFGRRDDAMSKEQEICGHSSDTRTHRPYPNSNG